MLCCYVEVSGVCVVVYAVDVAGGVVYGGIFAGSHVVVGICGGRAIIFVVRCRYCWCCLTHDLVSALLCLSSCYVLYYCRLGCVVAVVVVDSCGVVVCGCCCVACWICGC